MTLGAIKRCVTEMRIRNNSNSRRLRITEYLDFVQKQGWKVLHNGEVHNLYCS